MRQHCYVVATAAATAATAAAIAGAAASWAAAAASQALTHFSLTTIPSFCSFSCSICWLWPLQFTRSHQLGRCSRLPLLALHGIGQQQPRQHIRFLDVNVAKGAGHKAAQLL